MADLYREYDEKEGVWWFKPLTPKAYAFMSRSYLTSTHRPGWYEFKKPEAADYKSFPVRHGLLTITEEKP